jgi:hypothetical protein
MGRIVIPALLLVSAVPVASLFAIIAHDDLGIAAGTIRSDALIGPGFFALVAGGAWLRTR